MQTQLEILSQNEDRRTGMWTFVVRVVVDLGPGRSETGSEVTLGIDNRSLVDLYDGDCQKYLLSLKDEMVKDFEGARAVREKAGNLVGKRL